MVSKFRKLYRRFTAKRTPFLWQPYTGLILKNGPRLKGNFEGKLTATKKLVIHPPGIVAGNSQSLAELPQAAGSRQTGQRQATSPKARQS